MAKARGRPPKPEGEKRQQIGVRVSPELKESLEAAAGANGRSVAQESEFRLAESFELDALFQDTRTKAFLIELSAQIARAESVTEKRWTQDGTTYWAARHLIEDAIKRAMPTPPNYAEVNKLQVRLADLISIVEELTIDLRKCGAVGYINALLAFGPEIVDPDAMPRERWHAPDAPETPLSESQVTQIEEALERLLNARKERDEVQAKISGLLEPWRIAKASGKAIHNYLTNPADE